MRIEQEALTALVPNLILQPLVENAVRHGIGRRSSSGLIEISARVAGGKLQIRVRDDGPGVPVNWENPGLGRIGISNTRSRLRQLYGDAQSFDLRNDEAGGAVASLTIPFRSHCTTEEARLVEKYSYADR
jgi:sensor histidine kinase YesM